MHEKTKKEKEVYDRIELDIGHKKERKEKR